MAYWLLCQSCKQWSKSPDPLSDEKSCLFCSSPIHPIPLRPTSFPTVTISQQSEKLDDGLSNGKMTEAVGDEKTHAKPSDTTKSVERVEEAFNGEETVVTNETPDDMDEMTEPLEAGQVPEIIETRRNTIGFKTKERDTSAGPEVRYEPEEINDNTESPDLVEEPGIPETSQMAETPIVPEEPEGIERTQPAENENIPDRFETDDAAEPGWSSERADISEIVDHGRTNKMKNMLRMTRTYEPYIETKRRTKNLR